MTAREIFKTLRELGVPEVLVVELSLSHGAAPTITICSTVDKIIHKYHSTQNNEGVVNRLLLRLLKIHFNKK